MKAESVHKKPVMMIVLIGHDNNTYFAQIYCHYTNALSPFVANMSQYTKANTENSTQNGMHM